MRHSGSGWKWSIAALFALLGILGIRADPSAGTSPLALDIFVGGLCFSIATLVALWAIDERWRKIGWVEDSAKPIWTAEEHFEMSHEERLEILRTQEKRSEKFTWTIEERSGKLSFLLRAIGIMAIITLPASVIGGMTLNALHYGVDTPPTPVEAEGNGGTEGTTSYAEDLIVLDEWINDDDSSYDGVAGTKSGNDYEDAIKWAMPAEDSDSTTWKGLDYSCREGSIETVDVVLRTKSGEPIDSDAVDFPCDGESHAFGVQIHPGGSLDAYRTG